MASVLVVREGRSNDHVAASVGHDFEGQVGEEQRFPMKERGEISHSDRVRVDPEVEQAGWRFELEKALRLRPDLDFSRSLRLGSIEAGSVRAKKVSSTAFPGH